MLIDFDLLRELFRWRMDLDGNIDMDCDFLGFSGYALIGVRL